MVRTRLNQTDLKILAALREGEKRFSEIIPYVDISTAGLSKALEKLVKLGYIERRQKNEGYPPPVYYKITEEGLKALKQASSQFIEETLTLYSLVLDENDRKELEVLIQKLIEKYGIAALKAILRRGRARYNQILEDFPATAGTLSRVLKALESEGYITRVVDTNSRPPASYYSITEKGKKEVRKEIETLFMALMEFDPDEARKLLEELKKIAEQKK